MRRGINNLLTSADLDNLTLDLPPCKTCNTPRLTVEQRFCHVCGSALVNQSAFERCMKIPVENLPLTPWQIKKVKSKSLNTVGDFITLQDPGRELREIHQIGVVKSEKIYKEVIKTVDEFLA